MTSKSRINVRAQQPSEFSSNITIDNVSYLVQTEDMGKKSCKIITNIYLKGEIVATKKSDYSHLLNAKDSDAKTAVLMEKQHRATIDSFVSDKTKKQPARADYFSEVQQLLRRGNGKQALVILREGIAKFPSDPFLLSYYGCLIAIVENKVKDGITICEEAITHLEVSMPFGADFFYPVFYLNLGRAYLKGDRKADAISAFEKGLRSDPENKDLLWEIQKLGVRKKPVVPFLHRSNPINKYIGLLLYKKAK